MRKEGRASQDEKATEAIRKKPQARRKKKVDTKDTEKKKSIRG